MCVLPLSDWYLSVSLLSGDNRLWCWVVSHHGVFIQVQVVDTSL